MFISKDHSLIYPNFAKFILKELPPIWKDKKIWNALLEAAGIQRGSGLLIDVAAHIKAKLSLFPGTKPQLVPSSSEVGSNEAGVFKAITPDVIYISEAFLVRFEKDHTHFAARDFMKATILHELVHFLDYHRDGSLLDANLPKDAKKTAKDRGDIFEENAYGKNVPDWEQVNL